ncbi:MAG TPA: DNA replication and repair protein RecF [Acidimicrobiales bacterium]|nr:DNA replication and repair protein RecF [Acidimicrobiales bacterium]
MAITTLWLTDFRCFGQAAFEPDPDGLTVLRGRNGAGKTSVLEAIGWLATQRSIRGAQRPVLVRSGAERAVVRGEATMGERRMLIESEIPLAGAGRTQVNRHVVRRRAELAEALQITVFSPDDLHLVQDGPAGRRTYLDDVLVDRHARFETLVSEVERILRQRAAVLRQSGGRLNPDIAATLDVWDGRLAESGSQLAEARAALAEELAPRATAAYERLAGDPEPVSLVYRRSWSGELLDALEGARPDDVRRQATSVGPHRDDLEIAIGTRPSRTHASQGEQRSLALALRLATHELRRGSAPEPPVLLLDDVFSELDAGRSAALVALLPPGQVLLTTAVDPPAIVTPTRVVDVEAGTLLATAGES